MKKYLSIALVVAMLASMLAAFSTAYASDASATISVTVPENIEIPYVETPFFENFEGTTNEFTKNGYNLNLFSIVKDSDDSSNTVLNYDLKGAKTIALYGGTIRTTYFDYPAGSVPYTVNFDFKKTGVGNSGDTMWIQSRSADQYTCIRIDLSQFVQNEWYNVQYVTRGDGTATSPSSAVCTKTLKSTGETTTLTCSVSTGWTGQVGNICFTTYNKNGNTYTIDPDTGTTPWANVSFQLDNLTLSYNKSKEIETKLTANEALPSNVSPMLVAHDENGVFTTMTSGNATISSNTATTNFDITADLAAYQNAKSVKVLYWDGMSNAKAYAKAVEIGDSISDKVASKGGEIASIKLTDKMVPSGATGNYTVFAYAVPFTADSESIPAYDSSKHTILALDQSNTMFDEIKYDASLYDAAKQDIVIVCNADGAESAVTTLYEVNDAPKFTNVSMLLGSDPSQRNFTWFSLDSGDGKIVYEKVSEMIDGDFSPNAFVATATRDHDNSVYSKKEFYYQNQAVMTGLEPETEYCYQLVNGTSKSKKICFTTPDNDSTFSFAFGGDAQVGGNDYADYAQETLDWGRSLRQITTSPEFEGIEFFASGGDQIDSASTTALVEAQYDIYLNHDEFLTLPQVVTFGNHDNKPIGFHTHHFNQPNLDANYGATIRNNQLNSANYYFVYNSALFIVLNTNTFDDNSNDSAASRADDKADADNHGAFIKKVLDETKDNKDILWKIVLYHQSPYGGSYHGNYTYNSSGTFSRPEQYDYINMREYLMPYLYEAGVDVVLSGHDHCYTRTHILKPAKDADGNYTQYSEITPYANTKADGANYYTYSDGSTTPTFTSWTDKLGVVYNGVQNEYLKVKYKPIKVTDPDGMLHVTGATSSGSQVNGVEHPNHYAAVTAAAETRHMSRIDITPTSLKLSTYNLGTNLTDNITLVDEFEIERTAAVKVEKVELPETVTIPAGLTKTLTAKLSPAQPTNADVTWSSDNNSVATVDENGVVTAKAAGNANITVTTADGGYTATCVVTVVQAVQVSSITLPEKVNMKVGDAKTIASTIAPSTATTKELTWSSSDEEIATVSTNGTVTAIGHGTVTITARATDGSGVFANCTVEIEYTPGKVTLDAENVRMEIARSIKLTATVSPENASYKEITWSSSDESVATVDSDGTVKAVSAGNVTITASTKDSSASCTVTIKPANTFYQDYENDMNRILWGESGVWVVEEEEDGNHLLKFDGTKVSSKVGTRYTAQHMSDQDDVLIPTAQTGYVLQMRVNKLSKEGHQSLNVNANCSDMTWHAYKINMTKFEVGCPYDVKLVKTATSQVGYYKKASDPFWTRDNGSVWQDGYNVTSRIYYNKLVMYPYDNITDLTIAQKTLFTVDNIRIDTMDADAVNVTKTLSDDEIVLNITAKNVTEDNTKVFVAAYSDENKLAYVKSAVFADGLATVNLAPDSTEKYYKVFLWGDALIPVRDGRIYE